MMYIENENKYYFWWKNNKPALSLLPAVIFWIVSVIFFLVGLQFKNPIIVFSKDISFWIALALSISNTIIQIIGNEQEQEGLGLALWIGWLGSYALGIGTNVVGLLSILAIDITVLEWIIAIGLGTMIEVLPEKLLVQFLKTVKPQKKSKSKPISSMYNKPSSYKSSGQKSLSPDVEDRLRSHRMYPLDGDD